MEMEFVASMAKPQRSIQYIDISFADFPQDKVKEWAQSMNRSFELLAFLR